MQVLGSTLDLGSTRLYSRVYSTPYSSVRVEWTALHLARCSVLEYVVHVDGGHGGQRALQLQQAARRTHQHLTRASRVGWTRGGLIVHGKIWLRPCSRLLRLRQRFRFRFNVPTLWRSRPFLEPLYPFLKPNLWDDLYLDPFRSPLLLIRPVDLEVVLLCTARLRNLLLPDLRAPVVAPVL